MTREALKAAVLNLPLDDRIEFLDEVYASITPAEQKEIDESWDREVEARMAAEARGESKSIPAEEVLSKLERRRSKK